MDRGALWATVHGTTKSQKHTKIILHHFLILQVALLHNNVNTLNTQLYTLKKGTLLKSTYILF